MAQELFFDGFDLYTTSTTAAEYTAWGYSVPTNDQMLYSSSTGRFGSKGVQQDSYYYRLVRPHTASRYVLMGVAWMTAAIISATTLLGIGAHLTVRVAADGKLSVYRGPTLLATSTRQILPSIWNFLEFRAYIDNTAGSYELRVNGVPWLSATGVDTQDTASDNAATSTLGGASAGSYVHYYDDFHLICSNDAMPEFLGDCRVEQKLFTADSTPNDWVGSDGNQVDNYALVNAAAGSVKSNTVGAVSLFDLADLSSIAPNVHGVMLRARASKSDAGNRFFTPVVQIGAGSVTEVGQSDALSVTEQSFTDLMTVRPDTSQAWTSADINNLKVGLKVTG